jgi:hypothetical protein
VAGGWSIRLLIIILLLWLVEADVFQIPQLHKHLIVSRHCFETFFANLFTAFRQLHVDEKREKLNYLQADSAEETQ